MSLDELLSQRTAFDSAVEKSPEIDKFCSSAAWLIPAAKHLHPDHVDTLIFNLPSGYCALMVILTQGFGRLAIPLEASWGMGAPFIGEHSAAVLDQTFDALNHHSDLFDAIYTFGYPSGGEWTEGIISRNLHHKLGWGIESKRIIASLEGGMEGWLSRRTKRFRKNIRGLEHRVEQAGVRFSWASDDALEQTISRIFSIESRSWKGTSGGGITAPGFGSFYNMMLPMLTANKDLLVGFSTRGDEDLSYIFGGLFAGGYRGLQMSFVEKARSLGLGNYAQLQTIKHLTSRGILRYDLGQDMPYKHAWGEDMKTTRALVIDKRA